MTTTAKTFDLDATLPDLPVPRLEESIARYLESVRPLVDEETYADVEAADPRTRTSGVAGYPARMSARARSKAAAPSAIGAASNMLTGSLTLPAR